MWAQNMLILSMPSNGLSLNQWNLLYTNQISALSTFSLKIIHQLLVVTGKNSAYNNNLSTKMGVDNGNEVEDFRLAFFSLQNNILMLQYINLKADYFILINT